MTALSQVETDGRRALLAKLKAALVTPIRAMWLRYLPLLMIYYAYGALGLVTIAQAFSVKEALTFTPADLAAIAIWLTLPWTIKMVFGQLADSLPILGSQRRAYVLIGASLVASGITILAGAAGGCNEGPAGAVLGGRTTNLKEAHSLWNRARWSFPIEPPLELRLMPPDIAQDLRKFFA